jgi:lipoate-protein ligase B
MPTIHLRDLGLTEYTQTLHLQRQLRDDVIAGRAPETLLLTEHDPVVTLGRRGDRSGILSPQLLAKAGIDVVASERGGHVTYHGPGQLVAYPILNLRRWDNDLRAYVERLERVAVEFCAGYDVVAHGDPDRHGVYTARGKIASIGVHVRQWVAMHGIAINVDPDMAHWAMIAPCNLPDVEASSIAAESERCPSMPDAKLAFAKIFAATFAIDYDPEPVADQVTA